MQHTKIYLSLAQSRAWGKEWPIGDPYAFGKREMPVVAVLGAVAGGIAGVGMIGTGAALFGGAVMSGTLIGGALIAGAVMTTVGTITGNEKLTKWGSTLSMVGGIGAAAAGAGVFGSEAAKGISGSMSTGMYKISKAWGQVFGGNISGAWNTLSTGSNPADIVNASAPQAANAGALDVNNAPGTSTTTPPGATPAANNPPIIKLSDNPANVVNGPAAKPGMLESLGGMIKENQTAALLGGQVISSIGKYMSASEQQKLDDAIRNGEIKNMNDVTQILDPNDPNYQKKVAALQAAGNTNYVSFGINTNLPSLPQPQANPWTTTATGGLLAQTQYVPKPATPAVPRVA
jgi:hypothetical protein